MNTAARQERFWKTTAGLNGFVAVFMAAVGAHAVSDAHLASLMEKASSFQLIHAGTLLYLAKTTSRPTSAAKSCFLAGIILFCGSLYFKALTGQQNATSLAPAGGVSFMIGWLLVACDGIRYNSSRENGHEQD